MLSAHSSSTPTQQALDEHRWPALDGVRGAITIAVVISHSICFGGLQEIFWHARPMSGFSTFDRSLAVLIWPLRDAALPGMDVFFVLSSFLITGILLDAKGKNGYFLSFYARRTLRIFPLYYITLLALILALCVLSPTHEAVDNQLYFWTYTSNILLARGWEHAPEPLQHYWSLAVEEQFYIAWPFVVHFASKKAFKTFCLIAVFFALSYRIAMYGLGDGVAVYVSTLGRLDQLALGALLALQYREPSRLDAWQRPARVALAVCLALVAATALARGGLSEPDSLLGTVGHTVYACFGAAIVCLAVGSNSAAKNFFLTKSFRTLGRFSYAIYLFHQPLTIVVRRFGIDMWALPRFTGFVLVGQLASAIVAFALALGAAWLSWHLIETPMLSLRRYANRAAGPEAESPIVVSTE